MITAPANNKQFEMNIDECLSSLETLFKCYKNDSEFNYQLESPNSAFNQLKKLTSWRPIEEYFKEPHDWVLVQFEEKDTFFRGLPHIAEYRSDNKWHTDADDKNLDKYLEDMCKPIAFQELNADLLKEVLL